MKYIEKMQGQEYINKTRLYLDYLEEHLNYVAMAFRDLSDACIGMYWVGDDWMWHKIRAEVVYHDISKFSAEEFTFYRMNFFPIDDKEKEQSKFSEAFDNHKNHNHHHWETSKTYEDFIHMLVDWQAMTYKFGGSIRGYYEANKNKITINPNFHDDMYEIFTRTENYLKQQQTHNV